MSGHRPTGRDDLPDLAARVVASLRSAHATVAVAESLTGGLVAAALTAVPGASAVVRGGVVAYATDLKAALLGVPQPLLDRYGAVHPEVAEAMAVGVRRRLDASHGAATTGVAGPDPADGKPVGTVHVAVSSTAGAVTRSLALDGDRDMIRRATVRCCLELLLSVMDDAAPGPATGAR